MKNKMQSRVEWVTQRLHTYIIFLQQNKVTFKFLTNTTDPHTHTDTL